MYHEIQAENKTPSKKVKIVKHAYLFIHGRADKAVNTTLSAGIYLSL